MMSMIHFTAWEWRVVWNVFQGNPLTEQEVDGVMAQIDIDGDGIISYDEFIAATMVRTAAFV